MKVREIVINWLKEKGCDGLVNIDLECGCGLDDFMPCCDCFCDCEPAYKHNDGFYRTEKEEQNENNK